MPHRKRYGVGGPMGFCCPIGRVMGSGSLWGFDVTMKGFGVKVPMGFCCPIGRDLGSVSLSGFDAP